VRYQREIVFALAAALGAGRVDEEQMLKQRTRLLNGLRLVRVAGGDSSATEPGRDKDRQARRALRT
jgi:hypothetical protein